MLIGATFGSYHVVEKLGAGGMGEVYRAHDSALQREVALEILPAIASHDPAKVERLERFAREARALAALNHPHIGAIYRLESHVVAEAGPTPVTALVLELIEGQTLAERIERGPLSIAEATRLASQIARALEAAHEKSIVHRDLKPANISSRPTAREGARLRPGEGRSPGTEPAGGRSHRDGEDAAGARSWGHRPT